MKKILFLSILLFAGFTGFSQSHSINGTIAGLENANIYLMQVNLDFQKIVDTTQSDAQGSFTFKLPDDLPVGMYRIVSHRKMIDLIYNRENIRFVTTGQGENKGLQIVESVENMLYYKYLFVKTDNQSKMDILKPVLLQYPQNDTFYTVVKKQYALLQNQINETAQSIINDFPKLLVAHYVKADNPPLLNLDLPLDKQRQQLKKHYFENVDFADSLLLRSNVLTSKIVGYLALFQNKDMSKDELEDAFITAIDTVLNKSMVSEKTYVSVLKYFTGGFEEYGFEKVLQHLAAYNHLGDFCENSKKKEVLEKQLDLISKLGIGKTAPLFKTKSINGKEVDLSKIHANRTLLVFWASWCPHCTKLLPKLKKYYDPANTKKLQIIAISIDDNKQDVLNAIHDHGYRWINIAELKGWDGPIVEQYNVSATPTFYLLDKDKKIIAKPVDKDALIKALKQ